MKKGLFLFLIITSVQVFGQNNSERSKKFAEDLGRKFALSDVQIGNIYHLNLKTSMILDSLFIRSSQPKEGRIPLEGRSIEEEKELESIEKLWRKEVKKIIDPAKIRVLKKEENRENKKGNSSQVKGQTYEMFEITSKDLGFLNLYITY